MRDPHRHRIGSFRILDHRRQPQIFAVPRGSRQAALEQKIALVSAEKLTS
jgi:hypothetical protein